MSNNKEKESISEMILGICEEWQLHVTHWGGDTDHESTKEAKQDIITVVESRISELEARNKALTEGYEDMLKYPVVTNQGISNYGDGYNDALNVMRRLAEQILKQNEG